MNMVHSIAPVIIGAGPAGLRAAAALVLHNMRPIVIDEAPRSGGQIYRQPPLNPNGTIGFTRSKKTLYGFEAKRADAIHTLMDTLLPHIDYRPNTMVWNAEGGRLDTLQDGTIDTVPYQQLILATGTTDRVLPFPGWTLPGVYTLGGAQIALKFQGCAIGSKVVFAGTGPLLYLVAYQYAKAGVTVAAVLDTASFMNKVSAAPNMLTNPALFFKGIYFMAWLRAHGVPIHQGVTLTRASGEGRIEQMLWTERGGLKAIDCDALGFGYALRSETQLADLLGLRL